MRRFVDVELMDVVGEDKEYRAYRFDLPARLLTRERLLAFLLRQQPMFKVIDWLQRGARLVRKAMENESFWRQGLQALCESEPLRDRWLIRLAPTQDQACNLFDRDVIELRPPQRVASLAEHKKRCREGEGGPGGIYPDGGNEVGRDDAGFRDFVEVFSRYYQPGFLVSMLELIDCKIITGETAADADRSPVRGKSRPE